MDVKGYVIQLEGLLCGAKKEKDLEFNFPVYFLDCLKGRNHIAFRNGTLAVQRLKHSLYLICGARIVCT